MGPTTPSIWCVFALIQSLCLPPFFAAMRRSYEPAVPYLPSVAPMRARFRRAAVAAVTCAALYLAYPLTHELALKMVTR